MDVTFSEWSPPAFGPLFWPGFAGAQGVV